MKAQGESAATPLAYLASPHSHPDPAVREERYEAALQATARLIACGVVVYSPIAHFHEIAKRHSLPNGWAFWQAADRALIVRCSRVIVLQIPGWRESKGITAELEFARDLKIPIWYMHRATGELRLDLPWEEAGEDVEPKSRVKL